MLVSGAFNMGAAHYVMNFPITGGFLSQTKGHYSGLAGMYGIKRGLQHPHLGATYRVIRMKDKSYGVEVAIPDAFPATVTGLATKEDAERWIERHKNEIAKGAPQRSTFNSRLKA